MRFLGFIQRWIDSYNEKNHQRYYFGVSGEKVAGSEAVLNNHLMTCRIFNGTFEGDLFMIYLPGSGEKDSSAALLRPHLIASLADHFGSRESLKGKRLYVYGLKVSSLEFMEGVLKAEQVNVPWFEERFGKNSPVYLIDDMYPVMGKDRGFECLRNQLGALPVRDK